ncbi:class C sortase [Zhihengliuella flava]|uniref:Sortase A n=1 Tax=Zhihengliuella flava TaxID=1285193 RepID=A0A931GF04_9MICC|nr:class C sortase [Zhihengliuella flava]MBG6084903.1 sortase A [Zhihengliuella flava]
MTRTAPVGRRQRRSTRTARGWRLSGASVLIAALALVGVSLAVYPMMASWLSSYNQSQLLQEYEQKVAQASPPRAEQWELARRYNSVLQAGVDVEAGASIATGTGTLTDESVAYADTLRADDSGVMGRVKIASIGVDLPIYHGTSDDVLNQGAGHLEGSHLPVGGESTHSVITAHRGLAQAEMFTHLDQVEVGELFVVEVLGEALTYRVAETQVVQPEDTGSLRPVEGLDQVTLITCTPLGINSHRILVTGERVHLNGPEEAALAASMPELPGFPWWIVIYASALLVISLYVWRSGYAHHGPSPRRPDPR